jgi:hypothetical protein
LWDAPTTKPEDRQQTIRFLVERVVIGIERNTERAEVTITRAGGHLSCHEMTRPVQR